MTVRSVTQLAVKLLAGDRKAWTYLPYQIAMKYRRVDLGWKSVRDSGLSEARSHWHSNSGGPDLEKLLESLPISPSDSVIDIGCGKGGAILTLNRYPFARVDGVEISPNLAGVARANLRRMGIQKSKIVACDAADFTDLDLYSYFYMYNPFPEIVMKSVLQHIEESLKRHPRKATLIYKNPIYDALVLDAGFRKVSETRQTHPDYPPFFVYTAEPVESTRPEKHLTHASN
jgi:SAM-dependent methyltransferase